MKISSRVTTRDPGDLDVGQYLASLHFSYDVYFPPSPANVDDLRARITELQKTVQYSRDCLYSVSVRRVQIFLLVHALKLLMLFVRTLTYFEPKVSLLVIFYNGTFSIIKIFIVFSMNTHIISHPIMVGVIA
jgi:hypothetical protein